MRPLAILLCVAIASTSAPARAEGTRSSPAAERSTARPLAPIPWTAAGELRTLAQGPADDAAQTGDLEARIQELESRRASISTRGPRAAMITGSVLTGVGAGVAAVVGVVCAAASADSGTRCRVERAVGIAAGGAGLAIAGLIALLTGRAKLRERSRERDRLQQEIDSLRRQRARIGMPSIGIGVGPKNEPGVVLGWRF